jgi:hypothetical protein
MGDGFLAFFYKGLLHTQSLGKQSLPIPHPPRRESEEAEEAEETFPGTTPLPLWDL